MLERYIYFTIGITILCESIAILLFLIFEHTLREERRKLINFILRK